MKIAIDLDSTLNTLDQQWCNWIAETIKPGFTLDQWTSWNVDQIVGTKRVYDYLWMRGSFRNLGVQPMAKEVVGALMDAGHDIIIASSAHPNVWAEKWEWLQEHFPRIKSTSAIPITRKDLLRVDALVDDGLHNIMDFDGRCVLFDQPWNREAPGCNNHLRPIWRCLGWTGVASYFQVKVKEAA